MLLGGVALRWHDPDIWGSLARLWNLPFGTAIADVLMIALVAGGVAVLYPPTVRVGALVLGVVSLISSLVCIPGIVAAPRIYVEYGNFFEQFSVFCGAVALYAAIEARPELSITLRRLARVGIGCCCISFALAQVVYLRFTASLVPTWIPPNQTFWVVATTIAFALAALAVLLNVRARLALQLLTLMLGVFGILVWLPRLVTHPEIHGNWSEFALNFLIAGAAWLVAEVSA